MLQLLFLFSLIAISVSPVSGCSCFFEPPLDTAVGFYDYAASVYDGIVVNIRDHGPGRNSTSDGTFVQPVMNEVKTVVVTVYVYHAWKGVRQASNGDALKYFKTNMGESAMCGTRFVVGEEYLIYTTEKDDEEWIEGLCDSRYMKLKYAQDDISDLKDLVDGKSDGTTSSEADSTEETEEETTTEVVTTTEIPDEIETTTTEAITTDPDLPESEERQSPGDRKLYLR